MGQQKKLDLEAIVPADDNFGKGSGPQHYAPEGCESNDDKYIWLGQVLLFSTAVSVPCMAMFSLVVIFQVMSLVISIALFCVVVPLVYLALRRANRQMKVRKGTWVVFKLYVGLCTFLLVFGIVAILRVFYETAESQDLAWYGAPSNSSVRFTVYSHDSEEAFIEYNAASSNQVEVTSRGALDLDSLVSFQIQDLTAGTRYTYQTKLVAADGTVRQGPSGEFKTMPNSSEEKIVFASSSCSQRGQRAVPVPLEAYSRIADAAEPDFMLMLGDFIYADIPLGFGFEGKVSFGTDDELYKSDYRATMGDAHMKKFMENTGFLTMFDDHEIIDNYASGNQTALFDTAVSAWESYAGANNPGSRATNLDGGSQYSHQLGAHDLFVFDTRTLRDQDAGVLIGDKQLSQVKQWLLETQANRAGFKFLASPSPFTANHHSDTGAWNCGCPKCEVVAPGEDASHCPRERDALLDFIEENGIKNVVLISGDSHKPGIFELRPGIVEFSASPIHAWAQELFTKTEDKTLYQQNEISMAWAVYTLEKDSLLVEIYAGGIGIKSTTSLLLLVTILISYLTTLAVMRKTDGSTPFGEHKFVSLAIVVTLSALILFLAYFQLPSTIDAGFENGPVYSMQYTLK